MYSVLSFSSYCTVFCRSVHTVQRSVVQFILYSVLSLCRQYCTVPDKCDRPDQLTCLTPRNRILTKTSRCGMVTISSPVSSPDFCLLKNHVSLLLKEMLSSSSWSRSSAFCLYWLQRSYNLTSVKTADLTPPSLVEMHRHLRGLCCHLL